MQLPAFLLADNTDLPENIFIVHTEYPRFIWNVNTDDVEWLDDLKAEQEDEETINEIAELLRTAEAFYEREMTRLEEGSKD